jgi:transcriptional regulator with XRE-family HTH domain
LLGGDASADTTTENAYPMQAQPMSPIGDHVKLLRKDHGLTQEDLAAKSGLGIATIQRLERGGHQPAAATIASIAAAFDLSPIAFTRPSMAAQVELGSYLPLTEITAGKALIDLAASSSAMDFDYM